MEINKAMEWLDMRIDGAQTVINSGVESDFEQSAIAWQADAKNARDCIASLAAEVERLQKLEAAVRDDELIIQLVKNCPSRHHDDRYCDCCEGREAGMDEYQSRLLEILEGATNAR